MRAHRGSRSTIVFLAALTFSAVVATPAGSSSPAGASTSSPSSSGEMVPSRTVPVVIEGVDAATEGPLDRVLLGLLGVTDDQIREIPNLDAIVVNVPLGDAARLARTVERTVPGVADARVDRQARAFDVFPNDPLWPVQGASSAVGLPAAWSTSTGSSATVIAVVDSGVDTRVADLSGRLTGGYDFVDDDASPHVDAFPGGGSGHGTSVALVAAAKGGNGFGGAGACWDCRIMPVRVLDADGGGYLSDIAAGIVWAVDHGASVVNLSLGSPTPDALISDAVAYARANGVVVVASAGNDGTTTPNYPAHDLGVISVAGADSVSTVAPWSQRGLWVDVTAPGCNQASWAGADDEFCGTSSSAPMVSGIAGLLRSARASATRNMVINSMLGTARPLGAPGLVAFGFVDAAQAMTRLQTAVDGPELLPPDTIAPTAAISVASAVPGFVTGTGTVQASGADDRGVSLLELLVDGTATASAPPAAGGAAVLTWSSAVWADGPHELRVRATDAAGNVGLSGATVVQVDNNRPGVLVIAPTSGRGGRSISVTVGSTDAVGVHVTFLALGDRVVGGFVGDGARPFGVTLPRSGRHRLIAASVDLAGNLSFSNQIFVDVRRGGRR